MADKIDITVKVKEYEKKMRDISSQIQEAQKEIKKLKSTASDTKSLGMYKDESTINRAKQKIAAELQQKENELIRLEGQYIQDKSASIESRISEVKKRIKDLKAYEKLDFKYSSMWGYEYSEDVKNKKVAELQKKIDAQTTTLTKLQKQKSALYDAAIEREAKAIRKAQISAKKNQQSGPIFEAAPSKFDKAVYEKEHKYVHTGDSIYTTKKIKPGTKIDLNKIRRMSVTSIAGVLTGNKFGDYNEQTLKAMREELASLKGKELTPEYKKLSEEIKKAQNIITAGKRGTAFHKIAELIETTNLTVEQLTEDKIKELEALYPKEIGEGSRSSYSRKRLIDMAKDYEKLKKETGLGGKVTTEKSLGFLAQIGDEIVEITGTFDSFFSQLGTLLDFKTTSTVDPKKVGIQLNLLEKAIELHGGNVSGLKILHTPFRTGGKTGATGSAIYDVSKVGNEAIQEWIENAFAGTAMNVPTLLKSTLEPYSWEKDGKTQSSWMLNKIPISKLPSMIKQGRLDEIVGIAKGLTADDYKHFLNLLWSTKQYGDGKPASGVESYELYRSGAEWNALRKALPSFYTNIKPSAGISEETFVDEEGNVSGATTVGGGFLSQWSKYYRLELKRGGEEAAKAVVDQFVKIVKDSADDIERDEIFGKLSALSFKDDIHNSFIEAVDEALFDKDGETFYTGINLNKIKDLKKESADLIKKREEISNLVKTQQKSVYSKEQSEEVAKIIKRLSDIEDEIESSSFIYTESPTFSESVGINERSKEENTERAIRSQKRAGERYYREQGALARRLNMFEAGVEQLQGGTPEQVYGFIKGLSSLKYIFQGALKEIGGTEMSQLNEAGLPEFIENSDYLLDRWAQFVKTIKEKINPIVKSMKQAASSQDELDKVYKVENALKSNFLLEEDPQQLATKTAHRFSWLYQAKDIYDKMLSEEEPVKSGRMSVEEWAKQRLTPEQLEQYEGSIQLRSIAEGETSIENIIDKILDTNVNALKGELGKGIQDSLFKLKNTPGIFTSDQFLGTILSQTTLGGGESKKMKWWESHSALEYLKRGETIGVFPETATYEGAEKAILSLEERIGKINDFIVNLNEEYSGALERLNINKRLFTEAYKSKNKLEGSTDPDTIIKTFDESLGIDKYIEIENKLLDFAKAYNIKANKSFFAGEAEGPWMTLLPEDGSERIRKHNEQQQKNYDEYLELVDALTNARESITEAARAGRVGRLAKMRIDLLGDERDVEKARAQTDPEPLNKAREVIDVLSKSIEELKMLQPAQKEEQKVGKAEVNSDETKIVTDTVVIGGEADKTTETQKPAKRRGRPRKKKTEDVTVPSEPSDKMEVSSDGGAGGDGGGKKPPKSGGRKGKSDEEKAQADTEKQQKQDIREYQQYVNKVISLESQIDKLQRQATLSGGKHKDAIYGTIDALNEELGDLNRNNDALKQRVATEQAATKESIDATAALKKQSNAQKNLVSVKGATSIWDMMANDIRRATMRVADFGIAAKLLNKIPQDIQKVIQYTKELDAAMTNIRVVTGATAEEAQTLARGYTQLAKELGVTTVEVANSANEWARQGYEAEEANQLIVASSKLAKLGMISTTEATKDLTSAIKGFKLSTEDAMSVVDKLTKIDQVAAISAGNLAEGLARVSTTAQQAGLSLDETAAMVTTITEVTQRDASTAGEALRTLISRYSNVKAGVFTSMGEEAEETSGNINDIEKVLGKLGIRIRTSGTEMRSIEDVLDELAEKWDTLDDVSRNAVASVFAGVRQRESFNILLSNWDRVKELTEESANAAGTANEKYSAYMDSMEAATKRLQNAWEGFTQSFETSTVMKSITNAAAFLVENTDKLKYLVTYIAAAGSARIFDFFTNKGETGGFKGLIANIPFIGRGTKTNNILESIDKKVGNIEKGVGVGSIANQTKNGGLFKRLGRFLKTGFGFGDIYDPETGKSISYNSLKTQKLFKINTPQQKEFEKLLKQRKGQNAAMGAVSAVLTNILTKKQVGGDIGGSLMKNIMGMGNNEQIAEETALDKTVRVSFSGGLAAAGGALLGPLGAMLGQTLGEGFASMFSTWYHRDELEMKQQVADAKSKDKQLASIKESIDSVSLDLGSKTEDYETYQKRKKEVDALRDKIGNSDDAVKASINAAAISKGYKGGYDEILNSLLDTSLPSSRRESIKNDLLYIISSEKAKNYKNTQLIELEKLNKAKAAAENQYAGGFEWFENANLWDSATIAALFDSGAFQNALQKAKDLGYITKESFAKADAFSGGKWDLRAVGDTADERIANYAKFRDILKEIGEIGYFDMGGYQFDGDIFGAIQSGLATAINFGSKNRLLQDIISGLDNMITNYNQGPKLQSEWQSNFALAGIYGSGLNLMKPSKLKELGLEGSIQEIADFLENNFSEAGLVVRDETGKIIESVHDDIKKAIKDDETLYNNLIFPQTSIKEWQQNSEKLLNIIDKLGMKTESELAAAAEKGGKEFLDLAKSVGLTTTELRSLLNLGSEDYLSKMAQSINLTKEQLLGFAKSVKGLDRVALSAFTLSSSQLTEKFDLMREAYSAAIDGSWAGNSEILNKINSDNFIKGFITNINDASQTAKELGEILYTSGQSLEEFLQGFALFSDIMTSGSQMENFVNYLKETNPELKSIVIDMNNIKEVLDYIANNPDNTKLKGALEQFIQLQEIQKYNEALDKSIQAVIKSNEKQIENLTQQKEALGSINDERKKELEYIKAKDALENARKEKKRVYRVGVGWSYESDDNAIAEAVEKIETLDVEKQQNLLQTQIDQLEQQNKILENLPNEKELEELKKILKDLTGATTINSGVVGTLVDMYNNPNYSFNSKDYIDNYIKAQKSKNYQEMFNFVKDKNLMRGDYARWDQVFGTYGVLDKWNSLTDEEKEAIRQQANTRAVGDISFQGGKALINELGTEAVITPGGTLTALPSKTGIVPADITRNVWALGEVAPTLVAQLGSLTQKTLSGNGGNTTYEEGQYFDNFTMNVYPAKGDDFNKILEQARAQMRLTRHNN